VSATAADLVVRNGTILDGTGREPYRADVELSDGRIRRIGEIEPGPPDLDASGRFVAPGFVDIHSHSDYTLLVDPRAVSAIHQGVTLEVVGNCGHGCFPIRDEATAARAIYGHSQAVPVTWRDAAGYFERLEEARPAVNVASLVPNGQLRLATIGLADRPATDDELREMRRLLYESLEQGACGYSSGLEYAQERGATEEELQALCRASALHGGIYATHTRQRDAGSPEAVAEAVRAARATGTRLQVSHLVPRSGEAEATRCLDVVDAAAAEGLDIAFDMHTRLYGTTFLQAALPPSVIGQPPERLAGLLLEPATRDAVRGFESILSAGRDWTRIVLLDNAVWPEYARRDLASIAAERGQDPVDAVCDLLHGALPDTAQLMVINHCHTEAQQREAFSHPLSMPGSDATTLAPDGPLAATVFHGAYTWAAWYYRFTAREAGVLTPQEAVRRLTSVPAERIGLADRGALRPGAAADLVVFDGDSLTERGTTYEPNRLATGVSHVVVNGVVTLRDGALTGDRAGQVLRR
jgi:N-acyl-D-aspartate/D-glutamate deacylase